MTAIHNKLRAPTAPTPRPIFSSSMRSATFDMKGAWESIQAIEVSRYAAPGYCHGLGCSLAYRASVVEPGHPRRRCSRARAHQSTDNRIQPGNRKVYTVDAVGSAIQISNDTANSTIAVKVGSGPVAVDTKTGHAYVVNADDGTESIIDGTTDAVTSTVQVGDHPYSIAADSAAGRIYVSRTYSDQLMVIDTATNHISANKVITMLDAGNAPYALVVNPVSDKLHVANIGKTSFTAIDVSHFQKPLP